jgi:hypothetical protein
MDPKLSWFRTLQNWGRKVANVKAFAGLVDNGLSPARNRCQGIGENCVALLIAPVHVTIVG